MALSSQGSIHHTYVGASSPQALHSYCEQLSATVLGAVFENLRA
jgi:hypothetical protein